MNKTDIDTVLKNKIKRKAENVKGLIKVFESFKKKKIKVFEVIIINNYGEK
jgi:hypothetical protein